MSLKKLIKIRKKQICDFMEEKYPEDPFKNPIKYVDASKKQQSVIDQYQADYTVSFSEYKELDRMLEKHNTMKKDLKDKIDNSNFSRTFSIIMNVDTYKNKYSTSVYKEMDINHVFETIKSDKSKVKKEDRLGVVYASSSSKR